MSPSYSRPLDSLPQELVVGPEKLVSISADHLQERSKSGVVRWPFPSMPKQRKAVYKKKRMRQVVGRAMEIRVGHPGLPMLPVPVSCEAWPSVWFLELTQYPRCLQSKMVG